MSPRIEMDAALIRELENRIDSEHPTIDSVISGMLGTSGGMLVGDPFYAFTLSKEFRGHSNNSDRYLAILSKLHEMHPEEFEQFVSGQNHKRRYFGLSKEEVCEASRHNQARHIPSSKYWAIMNIDTATKRRFLKRLIVYIGYTDAMVAHVRELIVGK